MAGVIISQADLDKARGESGSYTLKQCELIGSVYDRVTGWSPSLIGKRTRAETLTRFIKLKK